MSYIESTKVADDSLKYHRLHPEYIHQRIEKMKNMYKLRIILVFCDIVSSLPRTCEDPADD